MRDCIIIGAGASGLFSGMQLPITRKKCILENKNSAGFKILLSWKGRCNFTNIRASFKTYLGDQTDRLLQIFATFGPYDMINFLETNGIGTKEEDNGRMLLKSDKARELLDFLLKKNQENQTEIFYNQQVTSIQKIDDHFEIITPQERFLTKKVILACGGQTFPKVGWSDFIFEFARQHNLNVHRSSPALCGIMTKEDFSSLSGSSVACKTQLLINGKTIYEDDRIVLFTHRGLSGPAIFNVSLWLGYHFPTIPSNAKIKLTIPANEMTKRLQSFLKAPKNLKSYTLTATPIELRSRDEAKVMSGGLCFEEVDENFELKKLPGIYALWEALNITGKTWGYNLQRCRSSSYICAQWLNTQHQTPPT